MNTNLLDKIPQFLPLTTEDRQLLIMKRNNAVLMLLPAIGLPLGGLALYAGGLPIELWYVIAVCIIFALYIFKESRIIWRTGSDLRGNHKTAFEAEIEDYKQVDQTDRDGVIIGSKYFFVVNGEKYEVGGDRFYKFGCGDTVRITVAPASRYAFDVEKIRSAEKSVQPDSLYSFTSPLS